MSFQNKVTLKIGMLGNVQVGKTSLMVKYVDDKFDEDYNMTLGVQMLEKEINLKKTKISLMIWDLGGHQSFRDMLTLVCTDSAAIFYIFDLTRKDTLLVLKDWYVLSKRQNKKAQTFLVGTKFDKFFEMPEEEQADIVKKSREYASRMKAHLVFCSAKANINIKKLFRLVVVKVLDLNKDVDEIHEGPLFEIYKSKEEDQNQQQAGTQQQE